MNTVPGPTGQGHSREAAQKFIEWGSVPTGVSKGGQFYSGIDAAGIVP